MSKKRSRRRFTNEFKAETVKLVKQSDRTNPDVAMELGISAKSVGEWVRNASESETDHLSEDERSELKRLRKEISELRLEKEILRKATVDSIDEVRIHRCGEDVVSDANPLPRTESLAKRVLRLAKSKALTS